MTLHEIETMRKERGLTQERLCQAAGITVRAYQRALSGDRSPRADTLAKLAGALDKCRRDKPDGLKVDRVELIYRIFLVHLADSLSIPFDVVMAHDPQKKATSSAAWMQVNTIRTVAAYLLKSVAGLSNAEVARAAGVTQAAMTISLQKVENGRDNPELDRLFELYEQIGAMRGKA